MRAGGTPVMIGFLLWDNFIRGVAGFVKGQARRCQAPDLIRRLPRRRLLQLVRFFIFS